MISKDEVKHIAKLSRLKLSEVEIEKMQKDLSSILDYFNLLKEAKGGGEIEVKKEAPNVLREDISAERSDRLVNDLISQAPERQERYIKVKAIL